MDAGMQPNSGKKSLMWLWIIVAVAVLAGGVWYGVAKNAPTSNTDGANRVVTNQNANVSANRSTTTSTNTNLQGNLTSLQYSSLSLVYPSTWAAKNISGAPDCRGFVSPELTAYNQSGANTNSGATDAVITYDVTVCNQGTLLGSLQSAAENWINNSGADDVSAVKNNDPFSGALRYQVTIIRPFDVVFFQRQGYFVRATLEKLPYSSSESNQNKITAILQSVN